MGATTTRLWPAFTLPAAALDRTPRGAVELFRAACVTCHADPVEFAPSARHSALRDYLAAHRTVWIRHLRAVDLAADTGRSSSTRGLAGTPTRCPRHELRVSQVRLHEWREAEPLGHAQLDWLATLSRYLE